MTVLSFTPDPKLFHLSSKLQVLAFHRSEHYPSSHSHLLESTQHEEQSHIGDHREGLRLSLEIQSLKLCNFFSLMLL